MDRGKIQRLINGIIQHQNIGSSPHDYAMFLHMEVFRNGEEREPWRVLGLAREVYRARVMPHLNFPERLEVALQGLLDNPPTEENPERRQGNETNVGGTLEDMLG